MLQNVIILCIFFFVFELFQILTQEFLTRKLLILFQYNHPKYLDFEQELYV